jgi:hypothetical protein
MRIADLTVTFWQVVGGAWRYPEANGETVLDEPGGFCSEAQRQQTKNSQVSDHARPKVDPEYEAVPPECAPIQDSRSLLEANAQGFR